MSKAIVWLRRDLRLTDNDALYYASQDYDEVIPVFIYDPDDRSVVLGSAQQWWLHHSLTKLQAQFSKHKVQLVLRAGASDKVITQLINETKPDAIYWNRCYEPAAIKRDTELKQQVQKQAVTVRSFNSNYLSEHSKVLNKSGQFFKVFTPYWRACQQNLHLPACLPEPHFHQTAHIDSDELSDWNLLPKKPDWASGFSDYWQVGEQAAQNQLETFITHVEHYHTRRDLLGESGTSQLAPYLHFGEISPRQIYHNINDYITTDSSAGKGGEAYLRQLGWREFSVYLLYHFPKLVTDNFNSKFDQFSWQKNPEHIKAWQTGQTGYPLVDAAMQELWQTGYIHNRARMVVASFLTKHLLQDWRQGMAWFEDTLLDADLGNNTAGWQWVAGCGADAAPYFRIFNPYTQSEKFDPEGEYIRRWCPTLAKLSNKDIHQPHLCDANTLKQAGITLDENYPSPIVDHSTARQAALDAYQAIRS